MNMLITSGGTSEKSTKPVIKLIIRRVNLENDSRALFGRGCFGDPADIAKAGRPGCKYVTEAFQGRNCWTPLSHIQKGRQQIHVTSLSGSISSYSSRYYEPAGQIQCSVLMTEAASHLSCWPYRFYQRPCFDLHERARALMSTILRSAKNKSFLVAPAIATPSPNWPMV